MVMRLKQSVNISSKSLISIALALLMCLLAINIPTVHAASDSSFISANATQGAGDTYLAGTWNTDQQGYRVSVVDAQTGARGNVANKSGIYVSRYQRRPLGFGACHGFVEQGQ